MPKFIERKYLFPFILITSLFALWGFANDITNPMVAAFKSVMKISNARAALVQFAFYGGYATMAIPAALFIRKYNYKKGILLGLILYIVGAFLFLPALISERFGFFLIALYILTFGLAFLETTANPYILSMGTPETATRRLNFAQAFNPVGSLLGMFVASEFVLKNLLSDEANIRNNRELAQLAAHFTEEDIHLADLYLISLPYIVLGISVLIVFLIILFTKMPTSKIDTEKPHSNYKISICHLVKNKKYREGVITQMFYVAAQIMCWTFIIQYAENLGFSKVEAQYYNIIAMLFFLFGRFLNTLILNYFKGGSLLQIFGLAGAVLLFFTITFQNIIGLYCLVATSICMSLMFPTIYSIALKDLSSENAKMGSAGLIMAIVGGALLPPIQGYIIDLQAVAGYPAVNVSFILPLLCLLLVAYYGYRVRNVRTTK